MAFALVVRITEFSFSTPSRATGARSLAERLEARWPRPTLLSPPIDSSKDIF